jgi:hypothetical protein
MSPIGLPAIRDRVVFRAGDGTEREFLTPCERVILTPLAPEDGRFG